MNAILGALGESSVRAILIAFATTCILKGMRVKSPRICHRVWTGVLMAMLCLPLFSPWAPRIAIPLLPAYSIHQAQKAPSHAAERLHTAGSGILITETTGPDLPPRKSSTQSRSNNQTAPRMNGLQLAAILYLAGFCVFVLRLLAGTLLSHHLVHGSSREGKILYSSRCTVPLTVGLFRPLIFLPSESRDWDPAKLDAVLIHEKEHMRRRDPLVEWVALLNRSLYWFNPLAWWLCRKLSALAEQACDEAVLARGYDSSVYAGHLLEFARSVKQRGSLVTAWGSSLHGSTLAHRVRRILSSGISPAISPVRLVLVAALWVAAAFVPLCFELSPAQAAPPATAVLDYAVPVPQTAAGQASESPLKEPIVSIVPPDNVLYETGKDYFKQRQYQKARLAFQHLLSTYPKSSLDAPAYLAIADSYYEEGGAENLKQAEQKYQDYVVFFPQDPKVGEAYMKIIALNYRMMRPENGRDLYRSNLLRTREAIEKFLNSYPDSDYRPMAEKALYEINRDLANQKLSDVTGYAVNESGAGENGLREPWIERIDIRGNRRIPKDTILFYIQSKPGERYDRTKLNSDVQVLYKCNFFDNVEVQESDGDSGKIITFTVDERNLIRSIQYLGNHSLTESEILQAYRKNKVGLMPDSQFDYREVRMMERVLKELLTERGKPSASIRVETESFPPNNIVLRFIIDEDGK